MKTARWIFETFGGDILVQYERYSVQTADYMWNNKLWELKTPERINSISKRIQKGLSQIFENPGGIVVDIRHLEDANEEEIMRLINNRMNTSLKDSADILIIGKNSVKVLRYKKERGTPRP